MRDVEQYFVEHNGLSFTTIGPETIELRGRVVCQHGISLIVRKYLRLREDAYVSAYSYRYEALIDNPPREIFRYDNVHPYTREGHADAYHKHVFDPSTGTELPHSPEWVGLPDWPTLREVLDELFEWWQETGQYLPQI